MEIVTECPKCKERYFTGVEDKETLSKTALHAIAGALVDVLFYNVQEEITKALLVADKRDSRSRREVMSEIISFMSKYRLT